ncbi:MAG: 16S rRNA (cytosine(1402)-N(4))-methyltransferase RsmH [Alphaproteobacteria bacterium]
MGSLSANTAATPAPHIPVLLTEVLAALAPKDGEVFVDGTFGAGGYSRALLDACDCKVYGIDRDPSAIAAGQALAARYGARLTLLPGRFGDMEQLLAAVGVDAVDGVTLDIGVSSMQIDQAARGFSFRTDGPLDMRMDTSAGATAADLVNDTAEAELADVIYEYGDERLSRAIARAIVAARAEARIETTGRLAEIVREAVRRKVGRRNETIDPATRTFQALRIAVNDELGELDRGLAAAERILRPDGRLAVVSFHSLEDRRVKSFLATRSGSSARPSRHFPSLLPRESARGAVPSFRGVSRKPVEAGADETARNPRARSARLRSAIRTDAPVWQTEGARA